MQGLINRAVQCFVTDSYGAETWLEVTRKAKLDFVEFEAMLVYDFEITPKLLAAISFIQCRSREEVMEDFGTYLVSHPTTEALRRLMRFGGVNFVEFLNSLDDLPGRARLAVSDLYLPKMELREYQAGDFSLTCDSPIPGYGHVVIGVLRAMADDYGALVLLKHRGIAEGREIIGITLVEKDFSRGRSFELGGRVG